MRMRNLLDSKMRQSVGYITVYAKRLMGMQERLKKVKVIALC